MINVLVDLIPNLNEVFLKHLCQNFRIIAFSDLVSYFQQLRGQAFPIEILENMINQKDTRFPLENLEREMRHYLQYLSTRIPMLSEDPSKPIASNENVTYIGTALHGLMNKVHLFRKLTERIKIDLVIVNSDWLSNMRCLVIEAKRLGIPTLDIEHGFSAYWPEPEAYKLRPPLRFISDYVNLDNQLEKDINEKYCRTARHGQKITFLANGMPNDVIYRTANLQMNPIDFSQLDRNKFTITIAGMWIAMHTVSAVFKMQIEYVELHKAMLETLARSPQRDRIQIIMKFHPKSSLTNSFEDERKYLQSLGRKLGINIVLITDQDLSEVLSVSNLVVYPGMTSAVWEAFMRSIPGILYWPPSFLTAFHTERLNSSNLLCREGCLRYVFSPQEFMDAVHYYMNSNNYKRCQVAAEQIRAQMRIGADSVEQKSEKICNWIKRTFSEKDSQPVTLRAPRAPYSLVRSAQAQELTTPAESSEHTQHLLERADLPAADRVPAETTTQFEDHSHTWKLRAMTLRRTNRPKEALSAIKRSLQLEETRDGLLELANIYRALGLEEEAQKVARYSEQRFAVPSRQA